MIVGIPKEIKNHEYRVGLVPPSVRELTGRGHKVIVETQAGAGIGFTDQDYKDHGAEIVNTAEQVFEQADMIIKVKEPQPIECKRLKEGQVLFTYLHLAPDPEQTQLLLDSGCTAIAYETVTDSKGGLPLLAPMSEVAGRMSVQAGAHCLEKAQGGSGILLGGVPGVPSAKVTIIGGGVVGTNALRMAVGMEANVTVLDKSIHRLRQLDDLFGSKINAIFATADALEEHVLASDLVVGAVLVPGAAAPKLVSRKMLKAMRPGSVMVDVAIDQGGCFESSRPTTHSEPTYVENDIVHYCVTNMPGGAPRTSTFALNNATLPFILALADKGYQKALKDDPYLREGLNVHKGKITYKAVAETMKKEYIPVEEVVI